MIQDFLTQRYIFRMNKSRTQVMLAVAWVAAVLCSLPQSFIFGLVQP